MTASLVRSSPLVPARPGHTPGVVVPVLYRGRPPDDHLTRGGSSRPRSCPLLDLFGSAR